MGEYAKNSRGESVKIGTCEEMYYLRFDQRHKVQHEPGNVDPVKDAAALRFRFPWPDEDGTEPGDFHKHGFERAITIHGFDPPSQSLEHSSVQFSAQAGYLLSIPCPESNAVVEYGKPPTAPMRPVTIHRNGFAGAVQLVQQRLVPGVGLVPILRCGGCGAKYRIQELNEIEALAVAFRAEGDKPNPAFNPQWWHTVADRILAGIAPEVPK